MRFMRSDGRDEGSGVGAPRHAGRSESPERLLFHEMTREMPLGLRDTLWRVAHFATRGATAPGPTSYAGETMSNDGNGDGWEDGETNESSWSPELSFGDPDAWRGGPDAHTGDAWRGDQHRTAWPRAFVGPEYLMWKRLADGGES